MVPTGAPMPNPAWSLGLLKRGHRETAESSPISPESPLALSREHDDFPAANDSLVGFRERL
ncbi:MAG TPA: hypothetical protein VMT59_00120 [Gaiellaceae bacterium]|nr:hypothetical protein [Gaiellaceae bacterium]